MRLTPPGGIMLMVSTRRERQVGKEEEEAPVSSEENNKALVRRFFEEAINQGNLDVADELLAPDFVDHDVIPGKVADIEDVKRNVAELQGSFSDYHFSIEEEVAEGDKVVTRTIFNSTHDQEEYRGVIPSGARITMETVTIHRVIEGKIVEARHTANTAGFWQQRLQREMIERAHRAGATGGPKHPASLAAQGGARTGGLGDLSLLPAR
jgi:predicted ester cyclase